MVMCTLKFKYFILPQNVWSANSGNCVCVGVTFACEAVVDVVSWYVYVCCVVVVVMRGVVVGAVDVCNVGGGVVVLVLPLLMLILVVF